MPQFFLDKKSNVPIYAQLKDQIMYYISTGALGAREQLPPVKGLAKSLGINFLTVRKAYKEVEKNGLLEMRRGQGTFISLTNSLVKKSKRGGANKGTGQNGSKSRLADSLREIFDRHMGSDLDFEDVKDVVGDVLSEIERRSVLPVIIFAECNNFQINQISEILENELKLEVSPVLIENLANEINRLVDAGREMNIVTTGFHVNEVRNAVGELPIQIDVLITNLNSETRRQLESIGEKGKYSFICRDQESTVLYKDLLKAELGYDQINLTSCTWNESEKVRSILNSSDVVLVSPPVYEAVRKLAPREKAVYNLFERVDPMSLKVVKDRILSGRKFAPAASSRR